MFEKIWLFTIQVVPVFIAFTLFEIQGYLHRIISTDYVPVYFSIFPFIEINKVLAEYFAEDFKGAALSNNDAEKLRKKIIRLSVYSAGISSILQPGVTGFLSALFLNKETIVQFLIVLGIYKVVLIILSIKNFRKHSVGTLRNVTLLGIIYFFYLGTLLYIINYTFNWASPYISTRNYYALLSSLSEFLFGKICLNGILITVITAVFASWISDREIRMQNLEQYDLNENNDD